MASPHRRIQAILETELHEAQGALARSKFIARLIGELDDYIEDLTFAEENLAYFNSLEVPDGK